MKKYKLEGIKSRTEFNKKLDEVKNLISVRKENYLTAVKIGQYLDEKISEIFEKINKCDTGKLMENCWEKEKKKLNLENFLIAPLGKEITNDNVHTLKFEETKHLGIQYIGNSLILILFERLLKLGGNIKNEKPYKGSKNRVILTTIEEIILSDKIDKFDEIENSFISHKDNHIEKRQGNTLHWIKKKEALVAFILILFERNYYNKSLFDKHSVDYRKVFEKRYNINIRQEFEKSRRENIPLKNYRTSLIYKDI